MDVKWSKIDLRTLLYGSSESDCGRIGKLWMCSHLEIVSVLVKIVESLVLFTCLMFPQVGLFSELLECRENMRCHTDVNDACAGNSAVTVQL